MWPNKLIVTIQQRIKNFVTLPWQIDLLANKTHLLLINELLLCHLISLHLFPSYRFLYM